METEWIITMVGIVLIGAIAVWRDPHAAAQVIIDILNQFSLRKKPNDIKRNDEDRDSDRD